MKPKKPQHQRSGGSVSLAHGPDPGSTVFDHKFGRLYADNGCPALPTRLMVGLHYLKYAFNESDESVVALVLLVKAAEEMLDRLASELPADRRYAHARQMQRARREQKKLKI